LKLLFVCTFNIARSSTGEDLYKNQPGFEAKSAGAVEDKATVPITKDLIDWADKIFCMENHHRATVVKMKPNSAQKTFVLDIPDLYYRNDPRLVRLIQLKVSRHLIQDRLGDT
jgi:predicted protein tyrosine phosphatase